ncbi:tc5 transposase [Ancylostoma duodenale]|uniref:Tc5 transposase n=1 Tax=Ancylostoma duodenale TaxID=51022 RepID=A0A0C2D7I8_9BILA|nr:tc5 transposase [Ancylostoma duodenale]
MTVIQCGERMTKTRQQMEKDVQFGLATLKSRERRKLRQLERERAICDDRLVRLRTLADKLKDLIVSKFDLGISLHDSDIRQMALKINKEETLIENFKASRRRTQKFKKSCAIGSRRITSFTSIKNFLAADHVSSEAQKIVHELRQEMENWPLTAICNADQSGFLRELHAARTLAARGEENGKLGSPYQQQPILLL